MTPTPGLAQLHPSIHASAIVVFLLLALVVFELTRRGALRERYAILWFALCFAMLVFVAWPGSIGLVMRLTGIRYPPSVIFVAGLLFTTALLIHLSVVVSRLTNETARLAQEVAVLKAMVKPS